MNLTDSQRDALAMQCAAALATIDQLEHELAEAKADRAEALQIATDLADALFNMMISRGFSAHYEAVHRKHKARIEAMKSNASGEGRAIARTLDPFVGNSNQGGAQ